jgi:hypothetical protein
VRPWCDKKHKFEVIVGKSIRSFDESEEDRAPSLKRFGFVQTLDTQSKRRLYEVLQAQDLQMNQAITFLSDGADTLRQLQLEMSPKAIHILDWYHVTIKLTVLSQCGKGLVHCEAVLGEAICNQMERLKWSLWHGQVDKALGKIDDLETSIAPFSKTYARYAGLVKVLLELRTYVVSKRFCKKQQMAWSKEGAHLLLQTRVRTLNGELAGIFKRWYPDLDMKAEEVPIAA